MEVEVVLLPRDLEPRHVRDRSVVVFDVLRATTTIVAALAAGARELGIFESLDSARVAACGFANPKLLCGESRCLAPPGFDLGNSPGDFTPERVNGRTVFLSTTNGTRAIVAARSAPVVFVAALINASATARALVHAGRDVTLLCAGTDGEIAMEDFLGAGAVIDAIEIIVGSRPGLVGSASLDAQITFRSKRKTLAAALRETQGGKNVIAAGLERDIDFAARLDAFDVVVARVLADPLRVVWPDRPD